MVIVAYFLSKIFFDWWSLKLSREYKIIAHNNLCAALRRPLPDSIMANTGGSIKSCGSLHCQRDSYARSLSSVVVSCRSSQAKEHQGKYELVLEDTVLFPEGGGQVQSQVYEGCGEACT